MSQPPLPPQKKRRALLATLAGVLAAPRASAARSDRIYRLGALFLRASCPTRLPPQFDVLKSLAALGYFEGRNLVIDSPCVTGGSSQAQQAAAELVRPRPDVLLTLGTPPTKALREATRTIPIVTLMEDPVASGLATSLARPGGNVTGLTLRHPDTPAKTLELLKGVVPRLDRLVLVGSARYSAAREIFSPYEIASKAARLVSEVQVVDFAEFERVFSETRRRGVPALLLALGQFSNTDLDQVAKLAIQYGVPTMSNRSGYVEHGGLMSFDMHHAQVLSRWASIIDKVFRGVRAEAIPWELPDRSRFAINLRTAKLLGLSVPRDLLLRADQVIE